MICQILIFCHKIDWFFVHFMFLSIYIYIYLSIILINKMINHIRAKWKITNQYYQDWYDSFRTSWSWQISWRDQWCGQHYWSAWRLLGTLKVYRFIVVWLNFIGFIGVLRVRVLFTTWERVIYWVSYFDFIARKSF